ncbi:alpha/beta fold hydrolase [Labrys sp. LIt4]|uniref:alpha/beta hydrolase n=1 Tax=Labrys sp. LIt4 TaxID=2821355 RepID=UPI001AE06599|nr:alpha/beta fold hydrolase [Labrys sp. LIt4]MBP0582638.1 alpha/beta fold hydrolase [Labrys sp. LIt4]
MDIIKAETASPLSTPNTEPVVFYSDGLKIDAAFTPGSGNQAKKPTIVCIHGYTGRKSTYMPGYIRELAAAGYNTLEFFHRGFGGSEGYRLLNKPTDQVDDILSALIYVRQRPDVDIDRIAIYGTSFGGSTAMVAAALDEDVRAVVSVGSPADVGRSFRSKRTWGELLDWEDELKEDRVRRVMTGVSRRVTYNELVPSGRGEVDALKTMYKTDEGYPDGYPMASYDYCVRFVPEDYVARIGPRAKLFIHARRDTMVPFTEAQSFYDHAHEPKELILLDDANHVDVYEPRNPEVFRTVIGHMLAFFDKHLRQPPQARSEIA